MTQLQILNILQQVTDPEIPVLSILDMGIVRAVEIRNESVFISITPTYSGCPAMNEIEKNILEALHSNGIPNVRVKSVLSPAWTTDWMTEEGKKKLMEYGIAPPLSPTADKKALMGETRQVICPNCKSNHTQMLTPFGSTACKALFKCLDCLEPFDYFKCLR